MENIYKIKIRSNPDARGLYPSERRYSASTVLGLAVVHLALAFTTFLLGCLSLTAIQEKRHEFSNKNITYDNVTLQETTIAKDRRYEATGIFNPYTNLTLASCFMTLGALGAGFTGLLAWKRWYIDHNITWFFFASSISAVTSAICLILASVTVVVVDELQNYTKSKPNLSIVLAINILIASVLEVIWSFLSSSVSYRGMKNSYPEDIMVSKSRGKIEVNTKHKGNKKMKIVPPDILNHFPSANGKLAKYFPKKDAGNLPKAESNSEYQERVNRFLSSNVDFGVSK